MREIDKRGSVFLIGYKDHAPAGFWGNLSKEFKDLLGDNFSGAIPKGATIPKTATDAAAKFTAKNIKNFSEIFSGVLA